METREGGAAILVASMASTTGADICADPSGYYVNYHSTEFPAGAIRGQLGK